MALDFDAHLFWGIDCGDSRLFDPDFLYDGWMQTWASLHQEPDAKAFAERTCRLRALGSQDGDQRAYAWISRTAVVASPWRATSFVPPPPGDPAWESELQAFATALGLPYRTPGWILASYWSP